MTIRVLGFVFLSMLAPFAVAQTKTRVMDHGRVMSCALDVYPHKLKDTTKLEDTKNYVFRGKVITLGKNKDVHICYDVEHMRVAGAWAGKPFVYSSEKNMGPTVEGEMLFSTKPGPGWAKDGKWVDPREGNEGPLPRDWAHYKGLYLHGDKVVLSYTVGAMDVLEMPEVIQQDGTTALIRTMKVGSSNITQRLHVHDEGKIPFKEFPTWAGARLDAKRVLHINCSEGGQFQESARGLHLVIAPSDHAQTVRLVFMIVSVDKAKEQAEYLVKALSARPTDPKDFSSGGPPRWTQTLETAIIPGDAKGPYVLDQIGIPEKNPWNASIRFAGLDFFPDGRAALCTWDGDVWIVSGLNDKGNKATWKRFAAGLQHPLGLKIINGHIYTAGRDQITKLHDLNNDGEADFYENINNDAGLTLQRHEFVMGLETDKDGNLYFCRSGHYIQSKRGDNCCIFKLSPDGKKLEKIATGFREPNGLAIGPDGTMTVADNEGNGIPQTPLYRLQIGKHYGFTPSKTGNPNQGTFKLTELPIVWLGPKLDTSAGAQIWAPGKPRDSGPWGPLGGHLLHTSYGNCALYSVLIDKSAEPWQGAVWKFPLTFNSGIMRPRFNPADGQLYVCGLRGWGTSAVKDGQFARIRYTGKDVPIPVRYRLVKAGIEIGFSGKLDKASAEDDDNWTGTWANILKKVPNAKETQELPITGVRLADDQKTVTVALDKLRTVPNFTVQYRIKAADGASVSGELHGTIHRIP